MKRLNALLRADIIGPMDYYFAKFITEVSRSDDFSISLAACLVSQATSNKHVCLHLYTMAGRVLIAHENTQEPIICPDEKKWRKALLACIAVGNPGEYKPLILDADNRLYLHRYWAYEQRLSQEILQRAKAPVPFDASLLQDSLDRLFPERPDAAPDMQKQAAWIAATKALCIITGGPGTGKTTTVAKILAVLLEQCPSGGMKIAMAAPTGKAAVRLRESIREAKKNIPGSQEILAAIPEEVSTIHRLLKPIAGSPYFKHDENHPLDAQVVVVDEASMVDMALMAKMVQAVSPHARLILIGDKDQLASVEAGSVLGDICSISENGRNGKQLQNAIVRLTRSYRFADHSGLQALTTCVNAGDFHGVMKIFRENPGGHLRLMDFHPGSVFKKELESGILEGYGPYLKSANVKEALVEFEKFKILCAMNKGPTGVEGINHFAEQVLGTHGLIHPDARWYAGKPVLITRNDYHLDLFNGDMGIIWPDEKTPDHQLFAYFPAPSGDLKKIPPQRLPGHETAFAMTIHKTQGSEFDNVCMVLPPFDVPLLTRELLYTGITRACRRLTLWADPGVLKTALSRKIQRQSGLRDLLFKGLIAA